MNNNKRYLEVFHDIVTGGICCGLQYPIEWAVNAHRVPGGSLTLDYYQELDKYLPQYLYEMFMWDCCTEVKSAQEILDWCDNWYKNNTFCQGYFNYLKDDIDKYIKEKAK